MTVTKQLVQNCLNTSLTDISDEVSQQAKKSLLNWFGVAIGAAKHPAVEMVLELKKDLEIAEQVSIFGRTEKADLLMAVLINGMSSHIFDFDDTHLDTINHPSGPVSPVVFALGEKFKLSPEKLLHAFIIGCEAELRIGKAVYPSHYDQGFHITSTAGVFGAAIAAGILLNLNEEQMTNALGLAGTQASGLRESFGAMAKPFHPGKAAQNGLLAALLAKKGFTGSNIILEGKRGFANVLAPEFNLELISEKWGEEWELRKNTFKPYACGIVLHPAIDACISLREKAEVSQVARLEIRVNPYVLELTGKKEPKTGLEGKFSIYHSAAVAFLDGDASEEEYSDNKVLETRYFREKIYPVIDSALKEDEAQAILKLHNGQQFEHRVMHATGSIQNPMTDQRLQKKVLKLTEPIIGVRKALRLIDLLLNFEKSNLEEIIACSMP